MVVMSDGGLRAVLCCIYVVFRLLGVIGCIVDQCGFDCIVMCYAAFLYTGTSSYPSSSSFTF